jgi:hypothetical protein
LKPTRENLPKVTTITTKERLDSRVITTHPITGISHKFDMPYIRWFWRIYYREKEKQPMRVVTIKLASPKLMSWFK